ncbi:MAG: hypothetical protein SPL02_01270 [Bacilli bacterium]|nr:hypothetical protein [Bacilli bacterium]MDY6430939.1 hypothetical protein [Bacilli bacterium]
MKDLSSNDFYDVKRISLVSNIDVETIVDLYLPLIGPAGLSIYLALYNDISLYNGGKLQNHEVLLSKLNLSSAAFTSNMKKLEAVSLISTFYQKGKTNSYFTYCIYAPYDPKSFFSNDFLSAALEGFLGEEAVNQLKKKYSTSFELEGFSDVSANFSEIYSFRKTIKHHDNKENVKGKVVKKIKETFDLQGFSKYLQDFGYSINMFSKEEVEHIRDLSNFYLINSEKMADITLKYFVSTKQEGKRVNFASLERECRELLEIPKNIEDEVTRFKFTGNNLIEQKVARMDECSAVEYLSLQQNGKKPSNGDLRVIEHLKVDLGLNDPVINAVVDYILIKNDNVLSFAYADKIGGSVARKNFSYAKETMDYLTSIDNKKKKNSLSRENTIKSPSKDNSATEEEISDEEMAEILKGFKE